MPKFDISFGNSYPVTAISTHAAAWGIDQMNGHTPKTWRHDCWLVASVVGAALLNSAYTCNTITCDEVPASVLAWSTGIITVNVADVSPLNCIPRGDSALQIGADAPGRDAMMAALLAAKHNNKPITIRIDDGSNPCTIRYVRQID